MNALSAFLALALLAPSAPEASQTLPGELLEAAGRYESESREFRAEVQRLAERRVQSAEGILAGGYEKRIRDLEAQERQDRLDAIAQFEQFLQRHPNDPPYTPDAMLRLAELYYERSSDEHLAAVREEATRAAPPAEERKLDFSRSIALYRKLIAQFPRYEQNDGALYLLGYCLEQQSDAQASLAAYRRLVTGYPSSRFSTEAWVRIGEFHFDAYRDPTALPKAADAYEHAVADRNHPLFDKALYKLGWTYYRMDRFDDAVNRFVQLVDYYQGRSAGSTAGGELFNEALQYTAISFADPSWGSLSKARELFGKLGGRPYEAEVYRRMGDVYFDQTRHLEAIAAYKQALEVSPLAANAPKIQQRVIEAYERDQKHEEAFAEAEALASRYGPESVWYNKYRSVPDALLTAADLAEKNLFRAATYRYQQALALKQHGRIEAGKPLFEAAAATYGKYVARFPNSPNAYDGQFLHGESLYNADHFPAAAAQYEAVRDSVKSDKHRGEAAFDSVLAWQKELEDQVQHQKIPAPVTVRAADRPEGKAPVSRPLAEVESHLVADSDAYVKSYPQDGRSAAIAYKAAQLYFAHDDFEKARPRFERVIQSYPKSEVARFATHLLVESFLIQKDFKSVEEVSAQLADNREVVGAGTDLQRELTGFKLAGRFKRAEELFGQGQYDEAAQKYVQLVDEAPAHAFADKALNNAAVAYENERRFDSAMRLYERLHRDYPRSAMADTALFRVAVNAENSYDFDKAVDRYRTLMKSYPQSHDRAAALFNAARLLEAQQQYAEAAADFARYAQLFPKAEDAAKNQLRAAALYHKLEHYKSEVTALNDFIQLFSPRRANLELAIEAKKRLGDAWQKLGNERQSAHWYAEAADEFDRRKLKADQMPVAAEAAATARFQLAEREFQSFDQLKISGRGKDLEWSFAVKRNRLKRVNDAFARVFPYKRLEWTLAALYRRGYALERFGNMLIQTPIPPDVKQLGEEAVIAYQELLAQKTAALEDKAVESYAATLEEARRNHVSNEWTRKTLESLNRYRPAEYPLLKEPKSQMTGWEKVPPEPLPLVDPVRLAPAKTPNAQEAKAP